MSFCQLQPSASTSTVFRESNCKNKIKVDQITSKWDNLPEAQIAYLYDLTPVTLFILTPIQYRYVACIANSLTSKEFSPLRQVDILSIKVLVDTFYELVKKTGAIEKILDLSFDDVAFSRWELSISISVIVLKFPFQCRPFFLFRNYKIWQWQMIHPAKLVANI